LKKELKKQIKQDEFASGLEHAIAWTRAHAQQVRIAVIAAALLGGAALGLASFHRHRTAQAYRAFEDAMRTFSAPLLADLADGAEPPRGQPFATAVEKYQAAAAAFDGIERRWPSLPISQRARYLAAVCRVELGRLDEAEKSFTEISSRKGDDALEPALARLSLADLFARRGQTDKAVDAYRQIVADTAFRMPRDHALFRLAAVLEGARRFAEARASYVRLSEDFPVSVYAPEARRRADYLKTAPKG
jgi:tetratricopeptide (TPR) repeat protein